MTAIETPAPAQTPSSRVEVEISQLLIDIRRIGTPNTFSCTFGELFDDALVEQYYEALVGTLKAAKKRGLIAFPGQFLLKGVHDHVLISICDEVGIEELTKIELGGPKSKSVTAPDATRVTRQQQGENTKQWRPQISDTRRSASPSSRLSQASRNEINNKTTSTFAYINSVKSRGTNLKNQSTTDGSTAQLSRVQYNAAKFSSTASAVNSAAINRIQKVQNANKKSSLSDKSKNSNDDRKTSNNIRNSLISPTSSSAYHLRGLSSTKTTNAALRRKDVDAVYTATTSASITSMTVQVKANSLDTLTTAAESTIKSTQNNTAALDQTTRIEEELSQLMQDIRRIGIPNTPSCTFGELFEDSFVEQHYEALVGTLKAAKKRGHISFHGQMLLKGIHDKFIISIVES